MTPSAAPRPQASAYASPWSFRRRLALLLWHGVWTATCAWTPKPLNPWRLVVLRLFGAKLTGTPFVHGRARIQQPWHLTMEHRACLGDGANAYSLGPVTLRAGATVAQEAYLCTGTHDFKAPHLPLVTAPVEVGTGAFVGARAFILPGVTIGANAIVGAGAVVTRNVAAGVTVAGNPARPVRRGA